MGRWQATAEELLRTRYSALVAHAAFISGDRQGAPDLVHEAFIATFARVRPFPSTQAAEAYVRRAIASKYLDRERSRGRERAATPRLVEREVDPDASVAVLSASSVDDLLAGLTPRERACVALRHIDRLSTAETAHALGISEGAVKRYLADGTRRIAERIGAEDDGVPEWAVIHERGGVR